MTFSLLPRGSATRKLYFHKKFNFAIFGLHHHALATDTKKTYSLPHYEKGHVPYWEAEVAKRERGRERERERIMSDLGLIRKYMGNLGLRIKKRGAGRQRKVFLISDTKANTLTGQHKNKTKHILKTERETNTGFFSIVFLFLSIHHIFLTLDYLNKKLSAE